MRNWALAAATLVGWVPGDMPAVYPPGTAKRVPAGSKLVFEVHYTPNGKEQADRSSVGIVFAKKPPEREVETNILANLGLRVPPREPNYRGEFVYTFRRDALLLSFMPHMHLRGTSAKYVATYPDGKTRTYVYNEAAWISGSVFEGRLTGIIDENNARHAYYRHENGTAVRTELAGGVNRYTVTHTNSTWPNSVTVTDPLGTTRTYAFQKKNEVYLNTSITQPGAAGGTAQSTRTYL